jgi:hypothetical protein
MQISPFSPTQNIDNQKAVLISFENKSQLAPLAYVIARNRASLI